jgi:shikimate dehydrogenase
VADPQLTRVVPSGTTRVAAVIGDPVRHSRSPALANAAFAAAGLDWTYVAFEVPHGGAVAAVEAMRALGMGGMSVTMPHKEAVIPALDRLSPQAELLGAVNCIAWDGSLLVGHNTDGAGLVRSLLVDEAIDVAGMRCAVLGAGGAARSVIVALAEAGAVEVAVVNRTRERAVAAAALVPVGRVGGQADLDVADLVVNATSIGMGAAPDATDPIPGDGAWWHRGQLVVDLVYLPRRTPLLAAATGAGARSVGGIGMLVHQAALAIGHWTGIDADVAVMRAAADQG